MNTLQLNVRDLSVEPKDAREVTINFDVDFGEAVSALVESESVEELIAVIDDTTAVLNCFDKSEVLEHFGITEAE